MFKSLNDGAKNLHVGYVAEDLYSSTLYEVVEINGEQVRCRLLENKNGTIFVFRYAQLLPCVKENGQLVAVKENVYYYKDGSVEVR